MSVWRGAEKPFKMWVKNRASTRKILSFLTKVSKKYCENGE